MFNFLRKPNTGKLTLRTPREGSVLNPTRKNNTTQKNKKNIPIPEGYVETTLMTNGDNFKNLAYGFEGGLKTQVRDKKTGAILMIPNNEVNESYTVIRHLMTTNQRNRFNAKHEKERKKQEEKEKYYKSNQYTLNMEERKRQNEEKKQSLLERFNKGEKISEYDLMNTPDLLELLRKNKQYTQQNRFPQWPLWFKIQGGKRTRKNKQRKHKKSTRKH